MGAGTGVLYQHADVVLLRATTDPGDLALPDDLDPFSVAAGEHGRAWLTRLWQRDDVRRALQFASPVLVRQIRKELEGPADDRQMRRIVISLASYLLRWRGRATPFGLFAGVAPVQVGRAPAVCWGSQHRVSVRAEAAWLNAVVGRLERHPGLLERLPVVVNSAAFVRGDRLVVSGCPSDEQPGRIAPAEVSVRYTAPVRAVVHAAHEPQCVGDLVERLSSRNPAVPANRIHTLLIELLAQGILLTALRPPTTEPDSLAHVNAELHAAGANELDEVAEVASQLAAIHEELSAPASAEFGPMFSKAAADSMEKLAERMKAVCDVNEQPLDVRSELDCDITLPSSVISEAEAAAGALLRVTPYPFGRPHWKDFHARFKTRYGTRAVVPVRELVADTGLGLPAGFLGSPYARSAPTLTDRDHTLLSLVQRVMTEGHDEIVLDESVLASLTVGDPAEILPPPYTELAFRMHAPSLDAVASGGFRIVVTGTPRTSSSMAGRFADLLPDIDRERLAAVHMAEDTDAIAVQLSFPPRRRSSENVVRLPQLLPHMVSLSEHRHPRDKDLIDVHDLAVTADARQLYLISLSTGRRLEPRILHALEAGALTPPLARFLAELPTARRAVYGAFDWGAAARLPYLPRVRYGRSILSTARWLPDAEGLAGRTATSAEWDKALHAWRRRWKVPRHVMLCENEQRLPLDLGHRLHRALLRARLDRSQQVEVREASERDDLAWVGRAHEFLIALRPAAHGTPQQSRQRMPKADPGSGPRTSRQDGHLPGASRWVHAEISGHPDRQDEILADHLPRLFDGWNEPELWWFSRYREMARREAEQHLDLYVRLPAADSYGSAAARVGRWAADLRGRGLVPHLRLSAYHPETGRFGYGTTMAAAEEVFATDSAAALAQITLASRTGTPTQALAAASLIDLASSYADTPEQGLRWMVDRLPHQHGKLQTSLRDAALALADPRDGWAALRALPGAGHVLDAWEKRRTALIAYRTHLVGERDPFSVMRSLLHLHHVRTLGVHPEREHLTNRLARTAALCSLARDFGGGQ